MAVLWILLWSVIPRLVLLCGHCGVQQSSSSPTDPSLLESLQCYNDYRTKVHCRWRRHGNSDLQLWFQIDTSSEPCVPSDVPDDPGFDHCTYETSPFAIGASHALFFTKNKTLSLSSADPEPVALLQELRALSPVNLSSYEVGDGGRRLQWVSPYPSSSSLKLKYRLSYRAESDDHWTTVSLTETSVTLKRPSLLEGRRYEARVQAHAGVGQWSNWSPVVTWSTKDNSGQFPRLHCVLDGEKEVLCSWEVSADLAPIITYQLRCRQNHTDRFEDCCLNPRVTSDLSGKETYSCSLTVSEPERLQLDLLPVHRVKTFQVHQHIQPSPPQQVKVKEEGKNWIVEWTESASAADLRLSYQIRYYKTQDEGSSVLLNISEGSTSVLILGDSLSPLQDYQVQVRSLVVPGEGSSYEGIPSEWTTPVTWTSKEASWSISTLIYIFISAIVVVVFLTLYCTLPACQRRILLWKESLPSPGKSKILSEIMSPTCQLVKQNEKTCICRVEHLDSVSTCSSEAPLWPSKTSEQHVDQNRECWRRDDVTCCVDKMNVLDTSSMSFSGPYIFCQVSASTSSSVKTDHGDKETLMEVSPTTAFPHNGDSYVRLPNAGLSRSTEDLAFHSNTSSEWYQHAEQHQHHSDTTLWHVQSNEQLISSPPPEYSASPFSPWPEEGAIPQSGYCHLPPAFMTAAK
ncbi:cytokine receptor common subunit beta isoform X2 [Oryzias melastigma]|uniref:cytokine receptor common subunit beta isoform X2 n=1 Tax=Oryzias melastigma TaxID=30732 RepID=UPI000CF7CD76|nr:cytokine receptor common subunit beta isoform X2 [Oryzias melastigma]